MKNYLSCLLLAGTLLLSSCEVRHYLYAPTTPQAPMFNHKGETNITGTYLLSAEKGDTGYNRGYDVQAAYAVTSHLALTAAFSERFEKSVYRQREPGWFSLGADYPAEIKYKRSVTELGMGYFTPVSPREKTFFDLYGGYGFGRFRMEETGYRLGLNSDLNHTVSVSKYFLQPGFHFNGENSQVSLALRTTAVYYYHIQSDYSKAQEDSFHMSSIRNTTFAFMDPSLSLRFWLPSAPWIRFDTRFSLGVKLSGQALDYQKGSFSAGFSLDFSRLRDHQTHTRKPANDLFRRQQN